MIARHGDEEVGGITVPEIDFQWCEDTFVRMGGIGAVGTDEAFRGQGIAGRMMQRAVAYSHERGYACGGVSTGTGNIARRLYSRAGYEYVFSMQYFQREPRSVRSDLPDGTEIRPYREGDEQKVLAIRRGEYAGFFGSKRPDASRWIGYRRGMLESDPESVLLAVQDGEEVGYVSYFRHWFDLACDICVSACRDRLAVGQGLLRAVEARLAAVDCELAVFSVTEDESFLRTLFTREGYRTGYSRVFKVNVLDLNALLRGLAPGFEQRLRTSGLPEWTGTLTIETPDGRGSLAIGDAPDRYCLALSTSEPTLTLVLCGRMSGWEAYLRGLLAATSGMDDRVPALLQVLLPTVRCCHPMDEWW